MQISVLEPYKNKIRGWRHRKEPISFRKIARRLDGEYGIKVSHVRLFAYYERFLKPKQ
jgi:hypothetical protein